MQEIKVEDLSEIVESLKEIIKTIIKAEKTTTGRVNLMGCVFLGVALIIGAYTGKTDYGYVLLFFILFLFSAILSDYYLRK